MRLLHRVLVTTLRGLSWLSLCFIRLLSVFSRDPLCPDPPLDPLLLIPATELAHKIRSKELQSSAVVQAYITRIQQVNPALNAVVCERFDEALREARNVDELVSSGTEDEKILREKYPFLGVPFTVKEAFALQGMPQSSGLLSRRFVCSQSDAVVVSRIKKAGGIPLGVTNCSELCMWYESSNKVYGKTRNPYNPQHIVGGSSGGEGCILGTAGSVIGVGSDIGGSIRMPAFFNGIYGHKPTADIVPNDGQYPIDHGCRREFLCTGPMCRYAGDLIPLLKVMAGESAGRLHLDRDVKLSNLRFFSMEHDGGSPFVSPMDKELVQAQRRVVEHLEKELGVTVQQVSIYNLRYSFQIWSAMMSQDGEKEQSFADLMGDGKSFWPFWELLKWMFGISKHTLPGIALTLTEKMTQWNVQGNEIMIKKARSLRQEISTMLGDDGILIYPSHPKIAPRHHEPIAMPFNFAYTGIFNVLALPVTQCPVGLSRDGLPLGIQLVASHYNDHLIIALAQYLEKTLVGWIPPGSNKGPN